MIVNRIPYIRLEVFFNLSLVFLIQLGNVVSCSTLRKSKVFHRILYPRIQRGYEAETDFSIWGNEEIAAPADNNRIAMRGYCEQDLFETCNVSLRCEIEVSLEFSQPVLKFGPRVCLERRDKPRAHICILSNLFNQFPAVKVETEFSTKPFSNGLSSASRFFSDGNDRLGLILRLSFEQAPLLKARLEQSPHFFD